MTEPSTHRSFLFALILLFASAALVFWLPWPSSVTPAEAPATEFSAARAVASLHGALGAAGGPHPMGTSANARVHRTLIRELEAAGWQVKRQQGVGCWGMNSCGGVENLIARRPGQGTGPAVLVACHTDSVPAGPGAGDDGAGMAVMLEMARNLAASPDLDRPVWLLFDEGEEMGLLGAELFVKRMEPGSIGAVVNLEARGTEGPVWMFETSDGGGELVSAYARSVPRPSTSSIAYSVYKRMPNDTDLTVFRRAGLDGVGLAFIDGGARYHTPRDDLDHLSTASVERMGQSTLALVRDLASRELPVAKSEAIFFDVASLFTVHWPAQWSWPAALFALVLVILAARQTAKAGTYIAHEIVSGAVKWLLTVLISLLGGVATYFALDAVGGLPTHFPKNMPAATLAAALAGLAMAAIGARLFAAAPRARLFGTLVALALIGGISAFLEPATCFPFLLAALIGGILAFFSPRFAAFAASLVLLLTLAPLVRMLPVGIGPMGLIGSAVLSGLIASPIFALAPRKIRFEPLLAAAVFLTAATAYQPTLSPSNPQPLSIRTQVAISPDGERTSRAFFLTSDLPDALAAAAGPLQEAPYGRGQRPAASIQDPGSEPVQIQVLARSSESLRLRLSSPQSSWAMAVYPPEGTKIHAVSWPGLEEVRAEEPSSWLRLHAIPEDGVEVELGGTLTGLLEVTDRALGLPAEAKHLADARPEWALPIRYGDLTETLLRVELESLVVTPDADSADGAPKDDEAGGEDLGGEDSDDAQG